MNPNTRSMWTSGTIVAALAWLSAAYAEPLPEFYGLYAVDGGRLVELKENVAKDQVMMKWQEPEAGWPSVGSEVRFIYFGKGVGSGMGENMHLSRMLFHRKSFDPDASPPVTNWNAWYVTTDLSRNLELRAKPVTGQPEMVMLVPRQPLPVGAYAVVFGESNVQAVLYVDRASTLAMLEASADCVDFVNESMKGEKFGFDKLDRRIKGGLFGSDKVFRCAQSDSMGLSEQMNTSAEGSGGVASTSSGGAPSTSSGGSVGGVWRGDVVLTPKNFLGSTCGIELQLNDVQVGQVAGRLATTQGLRPYSEAPVTLSAVSDNTFTFRVDPAAVRCLKYSSCSECSFYDIKISISDETTATGVFRQGRSTFEGTLLRQ